MARGDGLGDGEVGRVGDAHLAAGRVDGFLVEHLVREVEFGFFDLFPLWDFVRDRARERSLEDVLLGLGEGVEDLGREAEVFRQHRLGRVREPVREQEGGFLAEVAVVEDEQELRAVWRETLERVRVARGEVPEVAFEEVVHEHAAFGVEGGDAHGAFEHVCPLRFFVPVQLADHAVVQAHVDSGEFDGRR